MTDAQGRYVKNTLDDLWRFVRRTPDACWLWTGARKPSGYGYFRANYRGYHAHRAAYEAVFGTIPTGLKVCHHCDNPSCVRPSHLFLGTAKQNSEDMVRKGRSTRGIKSPRARLTEDDVRVIRARGVYERPAGIAKDFGVTLQNIIAVITRQTWRHL